MKKLRSMEFLLSLMVVSSIQVILLRLLQPVVMYVCSEVFLQDVMKHLVHLSCSREENTKYTVVGFHRCHGKRKQRPLLPGRCKETVPEGVEGRVAYKGTLEDTVFQLIGGIRSGMGYCGCPTIEDLKERGKFVKISAASLRESHPHDIHITKEAPNYSTDDNK